MNPILRSGVAGIAALALLVGAACSSNGGGTPPGSATDAPTATQSAAQQPVRPPAGTTLTTAELVELAEPAVVRIETNGGVGSGFIIDSDGYIITNNHVVQTSTGRTATTVKVTTSDGADHDGQVVGTDPRADIALVKIDGSGYASLELANLSDIKVGDDVVAIGYALDLEGGEGASFSVTRGIVSQKNRAIAENQYGILGSIQTDAAINHGNSGGPLLTLQGKVVGVNTALQPDSSSASGVAQGIGYAVGSDTVNAVYKQLRETGRVNRALLGVQSFEALKPAQAKALGLPEDTTGVYLPTTTDTGRSSVPAGPAASAGIQPGDVISKIGDTNIATEADLAVAMINHHPGETVDVQIWRDGKQMTVQVTLGTPAQA